jgi:hypothetical protein
MRITCHGSVTRRSICSNVAQGGSLSLWRRYFGPEALLFGIDIDDRCRQFDKRDAHVRIGSQDDPAFLRSVVSEMGGVDVVLDDGSHMASHQLTSFQVLFPLLNEGGVYICEDLHAAYSPALDGGYRRSGTFIEVAKQIVDDIHADFHDPAIRAWRASLHPRYLLLQQHGRY